ncbi:MAG: LysM peptidoglycan-binding domain-containing protein [Anaerolineales bacterium]|nr:LysM peptidoglycan-binding domain-containing protein [Anaerolineales bacterium]
MRRILFLLAAFFFLISCAPPQTDLPPQPIPLTPFLTSTSAPLQTPGGLVAPLTPLPSPTPFTYTVQEGDTLSEIAERFRVSLDDLQAANPEINANAMSVGQVLKIPSNPDNPSGEPTPTPAPFTVEQIECYPTIDKGMWCFVLAHNDLNDMLENVSAQVTLVDSNNATLATQTALLPLNILPPNASLPLSIFFQPEIPFDAKPQVQILTAIQLLPNDERYIPATVNNALVQVGAEGHSAQVSGLVLSQSQAATANQVWVAATVYDEEGRVVGVRRWESNASLPPGGSLPFNFLVSSVGGRIARVEFAVEARP